MKSAASPAAHIYSGDDEYLAPSLQVWLTNLPVKFMSVSDVSSRRLIKYIQDGEACVIQERVIKGDGITCNCNCVLIGLLSRKKNVDYKQRTFSGQ